jgi:hypothetical protein
MQIAAKLATCCELAVTLPSSFVALAFSIIMVYVLSKLPGGHKVTVAIAAGFFKIETSDSVSRQNERAQHTATGLQR